MGKGAKTLIIILVLVVIGLAAYIVLDKTVLNKETTKDSSSQNLTTGKANSNDVQEINGTNVVTASQITTVDINNDKTTNNKGRTQEEATKIAQDVYGKAYKAIDEGSGLTGEETTISVGEEGTVNGIQQKKAEKVDLSKLEPYFTTKAINLVKHYYTDTPYGHKDGNYYIIYTDDGNVQHREFISTIFGVTDQQERTFNALVYDDETIVAVSTKSSFWAEDEYIILKKVNNIWKIDFFE